MMQSIHQHERDTAGPTRRTKTKQVRQSRLAGLVDRLGNRGLQALRARTLQRKAEVTGVSVPQDPLEMLADRVADQVVSEPAAAVGPAPPPAGEPASETVVQRDALPEAGATHSNSMPDTPGPPAAVRSPRAGGGPSPHGALASELLSGLDAGSPMPRDVRRFMEDRFGRSFANVRVHTGERAAEAARSVAAKAFTIGSEIVFGAGRWAPETYEGKRLLAHELTHVVQQGADTGAPAPESVTEMDADRAGHDVAEGRRADVSVRAAPGTVQRDPLVTREPSSEIHTTYRYGGGEGATSYVLVEGQHVAHIEDRAVKTGQSWDNEWRVLTVVAKADYWDAKAIPNPSAKIPGVNRVVINVNGNITVVDVLPPEPKPRKPTAPKPKTPVQSRKPKPQPEVRPSTPEAEPKSRAPEQQFTPKYPTDAEQAADQVAHLSDSDLSAIGVHERALLLDVFANSHDALDVHSLVRLLDSTPEDELTELLDELFKDRGAILQKLASLVEPGDDAIALAESLTQVWNRSQKLPDEGHPRWRPGLMGHPVKMTQQQYDQMLAVAPRMLTWEIEHLEESILWQDRGRSWRTQGLGAVMGGFVDAWSDAIRPPTALEAMGNPSTLFFANPYLQLGFARRRLAEKDVFGAGELLMSAQAQNKLLLSMWSQYEGATQIGGQAAIRDIKIVRNTAWIAATAYYSVPIAATGLALGAGFESARQGVQLLEGSHPTGSFDLMQAYDAAAFGAITGPFAAARPGLALTLGAGSGTYRGFEQFSQGHWATGTFDLATAWIPAGIYGAKRIPVVIDRAKGSVLGGVMLGIAEGTNLGTLRTSSSSGTFNVPTMVAGETSIYTSIPTSAPRVSIPPRPSWVPPEISVSPVQPSGTFATAPRPTTGLTGYGNMPLVVRILPSSAAQAVVATQSPGRVADYEIWAELARELGTDPPGTVEVSGRNRYPTMEQVSRGSSLETVAADQTRRLSQQLGIGVPADRVLEAPWVGRIRSGSGELTSLGTSQGWLRNEASFWRGFRRAYPDDYALLGSNRTVTEAFARRYGWPTTGPDSVVGQKLIHHHMENSALVVAIPESLHQRLSGIIHARPTVVGSP